MRPIAALRGEYREGFPQTNSEAPINYLVFGGTWMRQKSRMIPQVVERFRKLLMAGMEQYGLKPADLADHAHLKGRTIARFNDPRTIECLCRGAGKARQANAAKLHEHAVEKGRSLSAEWAHRMLCMMHASKKVAAWRASHDPGEDDWLWNMEHARLSEPWGNPDPMVMEAHKPAIGIPFERARKELAREIARVLANEKNSVGVPWIKRVDEKGVAELLSRFLELNQSDMAAGFAAWHAYASKEYRVVADPSTRPKKQMLVRVDGRKSKVVEVPTGWPTLEVHYRWSKDVPEGREPATDMEATFAFLTHNLQREPGDRLERVHLYKDGEHMVPDSPRAVAKRLQSKAPKPAPGQPKVTGNPRECRRQ